jgi:hypothetical protein
MMPELYTIEIKQGSDYNLSLELLDDSDQAIPLTNYTFDAQIREIPESNQKIDFTVTTIPATGKVSLYLAAATTEKILFTKGSYDIRYINSVTGTTEYLLEGDVKVHKQVTR